MGTHHQRMSSLRRGLLLGGAAVAAGFTLSFVGTTAAHAADDDAEARGLLGAVTSVTDSVSSTVDDIDVALSDVVTKTAQVAEPVVAVVQTVAPTPAAAAVPPVTDGAAGVAQSTVDLVESATTTVLDAVDEAVEAEPIASVTDAALSAVSEARIVGDVAAAVVPATLQDVVSRVSSRLDDALETIVGDPPGAAVLLPDIPTGILDGVVGVIVPGAGTPSGSLPDATGVGKGTPHVEPSALTALSPTGAGRGPSLPAPGVRVPVSTADPPASLNHPAVAEGAAPAGGAATPPGSCSSGGGSASAGGGALHAALVARPVTTLCAGALASVSSDAVPAAPTYPTDVSPD